MINITKISKAVACIVLCVCTCACNKQVATTLDVAEKVANFEAAASQKTIQVSSNVKWEASCDSDWITVTCTESAVTIAVKENTSFEARNADVIVKANELNVTIKVTQVSATPSIAVNPEKLEFDAAGGQKEIAVTSNSSWTVTVPDGCDWIKVTPAKGEKNGTVTVTASCYMLLEGRQTSITISETRAGTSKTVALTQIAAAPSIYSDSLALVALYNASDGANWAKKKWDLSTPVSQWENVTVDPEKNRVTSLKFGTKTITAAKWSIPADIAKLDALTYLALGTNMVTGEFPEALYELKNLQTLDLAGNDITGGLSAKIANWKDLEYITLLNNNNFSGSIPKEIGQLKKLFRVNFSNTLIGGSIPAELSGCESLQEFMVFNAKLTGELPDIWDKFNNNFKILMLYGNDGLTGGLPVSLGNIKSTASPISYQLYNCNFTGNIPESFANLPSGATQLRIQGNKLAGEVPAAVKAHANWSKWSPEKYIFPQQEGYGLR